MDVFLKIYRRLKDKAESIVNWSLNVEEMASGLMLGWKQERGTTP